MKKLYTLLSFLIIAGLSFGQSYVNVTYQVDITDYLGGGATLDANGIRVGGNFTDLGALNEAMVAMPNWSPSDANCAMADMGDNVWSITVMYDAAQIGNPQQYKFVNGDWGTNEGDVALADCGLDDGQGGYNRELIIPAEDITYRFCWDQCTQCDGSDPVVIVTDVVENDVNDLNVYPNPMTDMVRFDYHTTSTENIIINITDLTGKVVATATGSQKVVDTSALESGIYLYELRTSNGTQQSGKLMKL